MDGSVSFLVIVLDRVSSQLLKCALKVKENDLSGDCAEFPMEPENRAMIHSLLPLHVQECGPIVGVEHIFEVHVSE